MLMAENRHSGKPLPYYKDILFLETEHLNVPVNGHGHFYIYHRLCTQDQSDICTRGCGPCFLRLRENVYPGSREGGGMESLYSLK